MSTAEAIKSIRSRLGLSQSALAEAMGMTQGNVSFYERGQTLPPDVGRRLIEIARDRGLRIDFNHIYGGVVLPAALDATAAPEAPAQAEVGG